MLLGRDECPGLPLMLKPEFDTRIGHHVMNVRVACILQTEVISRPNAINDTTQESPLYYRYRPGVKQTNHNHAAHLRVVPPTHPRPFSTCKHLGHPIFFSQAASLFPSGRSGRS